MILQSPLSSSCYDSFIFNTLLCCLVRLQKPRAWSMQALQVYFQSIIASKDFIYFVYCFTFVTSHLCLKCEYSLVKSYYILACFFLKGCNVITLFPHFAVVVVPSITCFNYVAVALIPILCWSFEHVAKFLRRNFSRSTLYRWIMSQNFTPVSCNTDYDVAKRDSIGLIKHRTGIIIYIYIYFIKIFKLTLLIKFSIRI